MYIIGVFAESLLGKMTCKTCAKRTRPWAVVTVLGLLWLMLAAESAIDDSMRRQKSTDEVVERHGFLETNLSEWIRYGFEHLPCFDHAGLKGMSSTEVHLRINNMYETREPRFHAGAVLWNEFLELFERVAGIMHDQMMQSNSWFDRDSRLPQNWDTISFLKETDFTNLNNRKPYMWKDKDTLLPFIQKVLLPQNAVLAAFGDLHGSLHSLLRELGGLVDQGYLSDDFRIRGEWRKRFFIVFLGDYVDRGSYGVEVFATLLRLKIANPDNVFFSRGNHEDKAQNVHGTFYDEILGKFQHTSSGNLSKIFRFYDLLPMAIFIGQQNEYTMSGEWTEDNPQYVQACHGGLEVGYAPLEFLKSPGNDMISLEGSSAKVTYSVIPSLLRKQWWDQYSKRNNIKKDFGNLFSDYDSLYASKRAHSRRWPQLPTETDVSNGFMWSDFFVHDQTKHLGYTPGRGFIFGKPLTRQWFYDNGIYAILRAHQHNNLREAGPMLEELREHGGLFDNWGTSTLAYTFLSATECPGFNFHADSFGLLYLDGSQGPDSWRIEHCKHTVASQLVYVDGKWLGKRQVLRDISKQVDPQRSYFSFIFEDFNPTIEHVCDPQRENGIVFECEGLPWGDRQKLSGTG